MNPGVEVLTQLGPASRLRVARQLILQGLTLACSIFLSEEWLRRRMAKYFPFGVVSGDRVPPGVVPFPGAD